MDQSGRFIFMAQSRRHDEVRPTIFTPAGMTGSPTAVGVRVRGLVQGVGFRPFVYHLANRFGLEGDVRNDAQGVLIQAVGDPPSVEQFLTALRQEAPALAQISAIERVPPDGPIMRRGFHILASAMDGKATAGVVPDAAVCDDCRAEIEDPGQRRHGFAFASCTRCGPRFSIVEAIPYDRPNTTMRHFPMCASCRQEYDDPADRRFHAQPIACPACGPTLKVCDPAGGPLAATDPLAAAVAALRRGEIVGLKGIGGYQLACDAASEAAVMTLRRRKRRPAKPFALMGPDLACIGRYTMLYAAEAALLQTPAAPIVLLRKAPPGLLAESLAPGQASLGWMLPTTPLHHLLLRAFAGPLVMTSGNVSGEPQVIEEAEAVQRLGPFVDLFLTHDRPIARRLDDSVARVVRGETRLLRRARGYAPAPLPLPPGFADAPSVLAVGGDLKSAICLTRDGEALLSQHLGDLEDARTFQAFEEAITSCTSLFRHQPALLACDLHGGYHAAAWAREAAARAGLTLRQVQHHHAHVAAVMAERGWPRDAGPVVGIALDGLGLGTDGAIWGGEILLSHYDRFQRLARLRPVPMPGGSQAAIEPWRNLVAHLDYAFGRGDTDSWLARLPSGPAITARPLGVLRQAVARGLNAPLSSSCGRLFDAVAAAVGIAPDRLSFEGEAAMLLEAAACETGPQPPYRFGISGDELLEIDPAPMWAELLHDIVRGTSVSVVAARFHAGVADVFCHLAIDLVRRFGTHAVAVGGGCLQNRILGEHCETLLHTAGLTVLVPAAVPANDGGLALGQAVVAAAVELDRQGGAVSSPPSR